MELRQLRYFQKACELKNFSEAARALYISQSTLSQQIKQLEDELGILLFDRIGKRIVPTEAGNAFLPYVNKAIADAESGKQIIRDIKGLESGELNIGSTFSLNALLLYALDIFTEKYPKIKVNIMFATSEELLDKLEDNKLDFVLSFKPQGISDESFETVHLFTSRLCAVVHKSHPLAGVSSISLKRLSEIPLILPEKGFATRKRIDQLCHNNGNICLKANIEINDVHTILHALRKGKWATILTKAATRGEADLVQIPILCAENLSSKGFLFWPKDRYRKKSAISFSEILIKATENKQL